MALKIAAVELMIFNLALEEQRVLIPVFAARRSSISAIIHSFWVGFPLFQKGCPTAFYKKPGLH